MLNAKNNNSFIIKKINHYLNQFLYDNLKF